MKATDIRRGHVLIIDGSPCRVMDFQHRTPGNLRAFVQVRFRNLLTGNTFDQRISATDFIEEARLDTKEFQVLYRDDSGTHVMDTQTYDQYTLGDAAVGDAGVAPARDEWCWRSGWMVADPSSFHRRWSSRSSRRRR
jgi:elongation factor P